MPDQGVWQHSLTRSVAPHDSLTSSVTLFD